MKVEPYLHFDGRCEEAAEFYTRAAGATVEMLRRFSVAPPMPAGATPPEGCAGMSGEPPKPEHVMHMSLRIGESLVMASDAGSGKFDGVSLALSVKDAAEARQRFDALSEGGQTVMPLMETFFSPSFGMLVDRFGVSWMVVAEAPEQA